MLAKILKLIKNLGIIGTTVYLYQYAYQRLIGSKLPYLLISNSACYPVWCRPQTSDIHVFNQIFIHREYSCLDDLLNVNLVIDCGANVGYSSAYFLSRFPKCSVIAVEPDPDNYLMMTRNLKPYHNRIQSLNSGVWSHPALLTMAEPTYRGGKEWSRQVRECRPGEAPLFSTIDIGSILRDSKCDRISILKIDIEGAEGIIFSSPTYKSWIDKVDTLVIELHDDSSFGPCSEIFFSAITKKDFEFSSCGELTVCKRIRQP